MRTYKLTIAYDGSRFRGWQRQPDTDLTIQGILERIISGQVGYEVEVNGSGRTDAGVHASGQTASIVLAGQIEELRFRGELNRQLPEDIRVLDVQLVKNGFHARYKAKGKHYIYTIDRGERPDVFTRKYAWHFPDKLDVEQMRCAAKALTGLHDFTSFTDRDDEKSKVRKVYRIDIEETGSKLMIHYEGTGFLYHMVRILTGTLLDVGTGRVKPEEIRAILEAEDRQRAGQLAPALGLCLREVYYNKER
ncbi:tRNA pseudouridine(38-40) synthase TruA [Hespellia stercorisuis]|uniref:tRNA pseudouridine synthase A n=1 Tax=Hespellia stercorisuis DSM 15480 TaxID=1121950 RepID=A0A1M6JUD4_9FIRM|nr:tRNA pseudouridine(38-40) synthase TruA [Hespellia stercorisuis]SHJ50269.1 tRNA pseudouridine38-40 synthase [Hespellia stercorisuis DSM 15480]